MCQKQGKNGTNPAGRFAPTDAGPNASRDADLSAEPNADFPAIALLYTGADQMSSPSAGLMCRKVQRTRWNRCRKVWS